jgi:hypothetical protein
MITTRVASVMLDSVLLARGLDHEYLARSFDPDRESVEPSGGALADQGNGDAKVWKLWTRREPHA